MYSVRDPWDIRKLPFPRQGSSRDQLLYLLNHAVLAPSDHNTQPWRFRLVDDGVEIFADRTRSLPVADPEDRELIISCGAALYQLRLAMRHFGLVDHVVLLPDAQQSDLLARVSAREAQTSTADNSRLFKAMFQRRSNRSPFEDLAIPRQLVAALQGAVADDPVWFQEVVAVEQRNGVADLVAKGDRLQFSDKAFRRELAGWIRPNGSRRRDGIPGYALGMGYTMSCVAPFMIRAFNIGSKQGREHRKLMLQSPFIAVLGTASNDPSAWLATGQAMARLLLQAYADGLSVSYMNQPVQVAELRPRLGAL